MANLKTFSWSILICLLAACGGSHGSYIENQAGSAMQQASQSGQSSEIPVASNALPVDTRLPWEDLDGNGFVDPDTARMSSAINGNSEFWRGVDAFETAGDATPAGQALRLESGTAGSGERSFATYRIPLSGENPATLSTDINLRLRSNGTASAFSIGIANYGKRRWDWFGGFSDGRIRLPLSEAATGDYISPLGNTFVNVTAYDGSKFDIVGISLNQFEPGDLNAPPVPGGLTLSPVAGGLELQWNSVLAADLAGYRIYWSKNSFSNPNAAGVMHLPYLEGSTRHIFSGLAGKTFVAISAMDLNGNESGLSALRNAVVNAGDGPVLGLEAETASGIVNDNIALTASGADSYDWDLDGDGVFDLTADITGSQLADTGRAGIIRPAVRASAGGTAVALGALSLIIASDLPPVAILSASPLSGRITDGESEAFSTTLDAAGSYDDGNSLEYAWDQLGDGNLSAFDLPAQLLANYYAAGYFLAAVRVRDSAQQQATAVVQIHVRQVGNFQNLTLDHRSTNGFYCRAAEVAGHPAVVYSCFSGGADSGVYYRRALDAEGTAWGDALPLSNSTGCYYPTLTVIGGRPAVAYFNLSTIKLTYRRADNITGQHAADWSLTPVEFPETAYNMNPALVEVDGLPAMAYSNGAFELMYVRATGGSGDLQSDWSATPIKLDDSIAAGFPDMEVIAGQPAVAYIHDNTSQVYYLRSTSATGASILDWPGTAVIASAGDLAYSRVNLETVNGKPAISYYNSQTDSLKYTRSSTDTGTVATDWPNALTIDSGFNQGLENHSLAIIDGMPALAYFDAQYGAFTSYRRALDANGSSWGVERHVAPDPDSGYSEAYKYVSLVDINGLPMVVMQSQVERPLFCYPDLSD